MMEKAKEVNDGLFSFLGDDSCIMWDLSELSLVKKHLLATSVLARNNHESF